MHVEIVVVVDVGQGELLLESAVHAPDELVEDVEVPLLRVLGHNAGFLQKEVGDFPADGKTGSEQDLDVFALENNESMLENRVLFFGGFQRKQDKKFLF